MTTTISNTVFARYQVACNAADSIQEVSTHECSVSPGSNDGFFITAFGKQYRYASIECEKTIAQFFLDIVSVGPIETIN